MGSRKDEILEALLDLRDEQSRLRSLYKAEKFETEILKEQKESLEAQVRALQAKLTDATRRWNEKYFGAKDIEKQGRDCTEQISALERELNRILDAERVKEELVKMSSEFRNSCLEAVWRKENRADGMGAKSYQIEGAVQLAVMQKALLADDMGLGKSLTSLITCDMTDAQRVIAVVPSSTMGNFQREVILWTPHRFPVVLGKLSRLERDFLLGGLQESEHFMLIVNFEAWRKDDELISQLRALKADTIIIDESHNIMTSTTDAAQGVFKLVFADNYCAGCRNPDIHHVRGDDPNWFRCHNCSVEAKKWEFSTVKRVIPMSGTSILNKPQELWPQLHIIDPESFPGKNDFLADFCKKNPYTGRWGWKDGGEAALIKVIGPRFICRKRSDVGEELPDPTPKTYIITQDEFKDGYPKQFRAYQQVREYAQVLLDPDRRIAMSMPNKITALMRLRQVLVWPNAIELNIIDPEDEEARRIIETIKLNVYESCKIDMAEKIVREILDNGDRAVVFSQFVDGNEELKRRIGDRACVYAGATTDRMRKAIELDFDVKTSPRNGDHRWDVVLTNYKSGGVGLNFNAANHIVRIDYPWNPGTRDQSTARANRIGQSKKVYTHDIMVEKSVDTWQHRLIEEKTAVIGGFEEVYSDIYNDAWNALNEGEM